MVSSHHRFVVHAGGFTSWGPSTRSVRPSAGLVNGTRPRHTPTNSVVVRASDDGRPVISERYNVPVIPSVSGALHYIRAVRAFCSQAIKSLYRQHRCRNRRSGNGINRLEAFGQAGMKLPDARRPHWRMQRSTGRWWNGIAREEITCQCCVELGFSTFRVDVNLSETSSTIKVKFVSTTIYWAPRLEPNVTEPSRRSSLEVNHASLAVHAATAAIIGSSSFAIGAANSLRG